MGVTPTKYIQVEVPKPQYIHFSSCNSLRSSQRLGSSVTVVGVDPVGSILAVPDHLNDFKRLESYAVEGIGYDFIPDVLDRELVDIWAKSDDKESLVTMRQMIREEGLLCGGSCGAAMSQALKVRMGWNRKQTTSPTMPRHTRITLS